MGMFPGLVVGATALGGGRSSDTMTQSSMSGASGGMGSYMAALPEFVEDGGGGGSSSSSSSGGGGGGGGSGGGGYGWGTGGRLRRMSASPGFGPTGSLEVERSIRVMRRMSSSVAEEQATEAGASAGLARHLAAQPVAAPLLGTGQALSSPSRLGLRGSGAWGGVLSTSRLRRASADGRRASAGGGGRGGGGGEPVWPWPAVTSVSGLSNISDEDEGGGGSESAAGGVGPTTSEIEAWHRLHRPASEVRWVRGAFNPRLVSPQHPAAVFQALHAALVVLEAQLAAPRTSRLGTAARLTFERPGDRYLLACRVEVLPLPPVVAVAAMSVGEGGAPAAPAAAAAAAVGGEDVTFEVEVCRVWMLRLHGVKARRVGGSALAFKALYSAICDLIQLV
ncbi:hypothetical protein HK405_013928 [Cladochytrium tenue]|nr:hypothetical protein HK405_013928 [Cladochytrium tenue]